MPQKKNPDIAELIRGKCGRVFGAQMALLTVVKGQPLAYNKDNQEDKEPLFDCADTVRACVRMFSRLVLAMEVNIERMREMLDLGFLTATELADELTRRGTPFRKAHEAAAMIVRYAQGRGIGLQELTLKELQTFIPAADNSLMKVLDPARAITLRNHEGGTAPKETARQIKMRLRQLS